MHCQLSATGSFLTTLGFPDALGFLAALAFLIMTALGLYAILRVSRGTMRADQPVGSAPEAELNPESILQWEFEYARTTASEALRDRHTMVNFYLLIAGLVTTAVLGIFAADSGSLPYSAGTLLLWLLCCVGWIYFLQLIRLRQAWHDSARAMNQIKNFYIDNAKQIPPNVLASAFYWRTTTLSPPGKAWTVFFYSAMLIALLDSAAFWVGGALLLVEPPLSTSFGGSLLWMLPLGLLYFGLHVFLYFRFLNVEVDTPEEDGSP